MRALVSTAFGCGLLIWASFLGEFSCLLQRSSLAEHLSNLCPLMQNLLLPFGRVHLGHVLLKLFLFLGVLCRWLTWGCCCTLAPTSVTCGISWTSLWSVGPWWPLPSRKFIFLLPPNPGKKGEGAEPGHRDTGCAVLQFSVKCSVPALCREERINQIKFVWWDLVQILPALGWAHHCSFKPRFLWLSGQVIFLGTLCGVPVSPVSDCENCSHFEKQFKKSADNSVNSWQALISRVWISLLHKPLLFLSFSLLSLYFHRVSLLVLPASNPALYLCL